MVLCYINTCFNQNKVDFHMWTLVICYENKSASRRRSFVRFYSVFERTVKCYFQFFLQLLHYAHVTRIGIISMICRVLSSHVPQGQTVIADWSESIWNLPFQQLKQYISTTTIPMATKLVRVVIYHEWLLSLKSHDPFITWSWEIAWQTEIIITTLPEWLWPPKFQVW